MEQILAFLWFFGLHWFLFTLWVCCIDSLIPLYCFLAQDAFEDAGALYQKGNCAVSLFLGFWWMADLEALKAGNDDLTYDLTVFLFLFLNGLLFCRWFWSYRKYRKEENEEGLE